MKKMFLVLGIAAVLTACNNSAESTDRSKDSLDSIASLKKDAIDSSADARKDAVDSLTDAKKENIEQRDSLNKKDTLSK